MTLQPTVGLVWAVTVDSSRLSFPRLVPTQIIHLRLPACPTLLSSGFDPSNRMIPGWAHLLAPVVSREAAAPLTRPSGGSASSTLTSDMKANIAPKVKENLWLLSWNKVLHRDGNAIKIQHIFFSFGRDFPSRLNVAFLQTELRLSVRLSASSMLSIALFFFFFCCPDCPCDRVFACISVSSLSLSLTGAVQLAAFLYRSEFITN